MFEWIEKNYFRISFPLLFIWYFSAGWEKLNEELNPLFKAVSLVFMGALFAGFFSVLIYFVSNIIFSFIESGVNAVKEESTLAGKVKAGVFWTVALLLFILGS